MADRYLIETSTVDGYLLEDGTGVLLNEQDVIAVTGTAASAFGWTDAATGAEDFTGTAASAFGWTDSATGEEGFAGTLASAFGWTDSATGGEGFAGTLASAFGWTDSATGTAIMNITATGASAFGWTDAATGEESFIGVAASAFGWTDASTGAEGFSGVAASAFGWTDAATGDIVTLQPVTGVGASAFGWSMAATDIDPCVALATTQFQLDCLVYWRNFDSAATVTERNRLQKVFLLEHGARIVIRDDMQMLVGGMYPVRWCTL